MKSLSKLLLCACLCISISYPLLGQSNADIDALKSQHQQLVEQRNTSDTDIEILKLKIAKQEAKIAPSRRGMLSAELALKDAEKAFEADPSDANNSKAENAKFKFFLAERKYNKASSKNRKLINQLDDLQKAKRLNAVEIEDALTQIERAKANQAAAPIVVAKPVAVKPTPVKPAPKPVVKAKPVVAAKPAPKKPISPPPAKVVAKPKTTTPAKPSAKAIAAKPAVIKAPAAKVPTAKMASKKPAPKPVYKAPKKTAVAKPAPKPVAPAPATIDVQLTETQREALAGMKHQIPEFVGRFQPLTIVKPAKKAKPAAAAPVNQAVSLSEDDRQMARVKARIEALEKSATRRSKNAEVNQILSLAAEGSDTKSRVTMQHLADKQYTGSATLDQAVNTLSARSQNWTVTIDAADLGKTAVFLLDASKKPAELSWYIK